MIKEPIKYGGTWAQMQRQLASAQDILATADSVHQQHTQYYILPDCYEYDSTDDGPEVDIIRRFLDYEILRERIEYVIVEQAAREFIETMCEDFFLQRLARTISRRNP
jgi:hypothetical protein